jgi:hypothetical protein
MCEIREGLPKFHNFEYNITDILPDYTMSAPTMSAPTIHDDDMFADNATFQIIDSAEDEFIRYSGFHRDIESLIYALEHMAEHLPNRLVCCTYQIGYNTYDIPRGLGGCEIDANLTGKEWLRNIRKSIVGHYNH